MKKIIVLGSNFAGATAAFELKRKLKDEVEILVISSSQKFWYIPSLIWVPFGMRTVDEISFELAPIFQKKNISFLAEPSKKIYPEKKTSRDRVGESF